MFLHYFIISLYPILYTYISNYYEVEFFDILIPTILIITLNLILKIILNFKINKLKNSLIISFFWLFFWFYNDFRLIIFNYSIIGQNRFFLPISLIILSLFLFFIIKYKSEDNIININKFLNFVSMILICFLIFDFSVKIYNEKNLVTINYNNEKKDDIPVDKKFNLKNYPNIYYIILDSYPNSKTLSKIYNYDNNQFLTFLKEKGFYIVENSTSNYAFTMLSLTSILNAEYLNKTSNVIGENSNNSKTFYRIFRKEKVLKLLENNGYMIYKVNYTPFNVLKQDEKLYNSKSFIFQEFYINLFKKSFLSIFENILFADIFRDSVNNSFADILKLSKYNSNKPKIVFAHIQCPHEPIIFGPNGEKINQGLSGILGTNSILVKNQILYVNKKVIELLNKMFENNTKNSVIIIQSDHGPACMTHPLRKCMENKEINFNDDFIRDQMRNFCAIYFPKKSKYIYNSITPVNTFRLILKEYFDDNIKLLDDKNYFSTFTLPFKFYDFTEKVKFSEQLYHKPIKLN